MKSWEIIADEISRDGWCWGMSEAIIEGKRMFVVDAHRGDLLPRHIVKADTLLGAFLELKNELRDPSVSPQSLLPFCVSRPLHPPAKGHIILPAGLKLQGQVTTRIERIAIWQRDPCPITFPVLHMLWMSLLRGFQIAFLLK